MAAFTPLRYPDNLTRKYWDKKKGMLAKAAGKTGVGEAAEKAEAAFDKIKWEPFDIVKLTPLASNAETLKEVAELKTGVTAEWNRSVKPAAEALKKLRTTAEDASKKFAKNKLLKDDVKLADVIAKDADMFSVALQLNGIFFEQVAKEWKQSHGLIEKNIALQREVATKTKEYLMALLAGLSKVQNFGDPKDPQYVVDVKKLWNDDVKQQGRSVSNNLKTNIDLAKKHLKTWTSKFQGFDWDTLDFSSDAAKLKPELVKFIGAVKVESMELLKDLK